MIQGFLIVRLIFMLDGTYDNNIISTIKPSNKECLNNVFEDNQLKLNNCEEISSKTLNKEQKTEFNGKAKSKNQKLKRVRILNINENFRLKKYLKKRTRLSKSLKACKPNSNPKI